MSAACRERAGGVRRKPRKLPSDISDHSARVPTAQNRRKLPQIGIGTLGPGDGVLGLWAPQGGQNETTQCKGSVEAKVPRYILAKSHPFGHFSWVFSTFLGLGLHFGTPLLPGTRRGTLVGTLVGTGTRRGTWLGLCLEAGILLGTFTGSWDFALNLPWGLLCGLAALSLHRLGFCLGLSLEAGILL